MNFTAWAKEQGLKPETPEFDAADRAWRAALYQMATLTNIIADRRLTVRAYCDKIATLLRD